MWLAGGGIKAGMTHGETDDFSYNVVKDPVDVHDLHATLLHCLGWIIPGSLSSSRAGTTG